MIDYQNITKAHALCLMSTYPHPPYFKRGNQIRLTAGCFNIFPFMDIYT